ncbi:MAG: hypothetical protein JXB39_08600 [Deltaproteobacteria bacterium]|nr:hypothetical protein [Deltaproteobacteria bacterium]
MSGLVVAVAATFPLVAHPLDHLPGAAMAGGLSHAWRAWWTWIAVAVRHENPAWTDLLNFPAGFPVGFHLGNVLDVLLVLPITGIAGPVASAVAWCLGSLALSTWAAAWLGHRTGLPAPIAVLAGLLWAFAPHHLAFLMGGAYENLASPFLPLLLVALLDLLDPDLPAGVLGRAGRAAGVAGCLFGLSLTVWFSGLVAGLLAGLVVAALLTVHRRAVLPGAAWALAGLAVGAAVTWAASRVLLPIVPSPLGRMTVRSAPMDSLCRAWLHGLPVDAVLPSGMLWLNHHVLGGVAVLALLGAMSRKGRFWLLLAVPFLLDAALPETWLNGSFQTPAILRGVKPHLQTLLGSGERRLFPLHLALALAAGHGLAWGLHRIRASLRVTRAAVLLALVAWVAEQRLLGPIPLPVPCFEARTGAWTAEVARGPAGAVLDVPILLEGSGVPGWVVKGIHSRYMFDQTAHGRPIFTATGSRFVMNERQLPVQDPLVRALLPFGRGVLAARTGPVEDLPGAPQDRRGPWNRATAGWTPAGLQAAGYAWVVLHEALLDPWDATFLEAALEDLLGPPLAPGEGVLLFGVPDPGPHEPIVVAPGRKGR